MATIDRVAGSRQSDVPPLPRLPSAPAQGRHDGVPLLTVGHGPDDRARLAARLQAAGVGSVVDVRRFPGSRHNPDVARDALAAWLPGRGSATGGRSGSAGGAGCRPGEPVVDGWWTVAQFAAYAAHTRTPDFAAALDEVLEAASRGAVAVMCSESVWWRCHRRLVADVVVLARGLPVEHLLPDGRPAPHRASAGAVLGDDGRVRWPS